MTVYYAEFKISLHTDDTGDAYLKYGDVTDKMIKDWGEPLNFSARTSSGLCTAFGYIELANATIEGDTFKMYIDTDNKDSFKIGTITRLIYVIKFLSMFFVGEYVMGSHRKQFLKIDEPFTFGQYYKEYGKPIELWFPNDFLQYCVEVIKINPIVKNDTKIKLFNELKPQYSKKGYYIEYPLYPYFINADANLKIVAEGDNNKYYPVEYEDNKLIITDYENQFKDVKQIDLHITIEGGDNNVKQ